MGDPRVFQTGATRDTAEGKPESHKYSCPRVEESFDAFMQRNQTTSDGKPRAGDNWKKGMPVDVLLASLTRHYKAVWKALDDPPDAPFAGEFSKKTIEHLHAIRFNANALVRHALKQDPDGKPGFWSRYCQLHGMWWALGQEAPCPVCSKGEEVPI